MKWDEFKAGVERINGRFHRQIVEPELDELWGSVRHVGGAQWDRTVQQILNTRQRAPDNWTALILEVGGITPPDGHAYRRPQVHEPTLTDAEVQAGRCFAAANRMAVGEPDAVAALQAVGDAVAVSSPGDCPCDNGLLTYQPVGDGLALAGPCPNDCGNAAKVREEVSKRGALPVVKIGERKPVRWIPMGVNRDLRTYSGLTKVGA